MVLASSFPRTRESRFAPRRISLIPAFAGIREPKSSLRFVDVPAHLFSKDDHEGREGFTYLNQNFGVWFFLRALPVLGSE